jgi:hypothetical protein
MFNHPEKVSKGKDIATGGDNMDFSKEDLKGIVLSSYELMIKIPAPEWNHNSKKYEIKSKSKLKTLSEALNEITDASASITHFVKNASYFLPRAERTGKDDLVMLPFLDLLLAKVKEIENEEYLFTWEKIPGNDSLRLKDYLRKKYGADSVKSANIEKIDDGNTIRATAEKNSFSLNLNDTKTEVKLQIDDGIIEKFAVKTENGKLNIYNKDVDAKNAREKIKYLIGYTNWNTDAVCTVFTASNNNEVEMKNRLENMLGAELDIIGAKEQVGKIMGDIMNWKSGSKKESYGRR